MSDLGPIDWNKEAYLGILRSMAHFRCLLKHRTLVDEETGASEGVVLSGDDSQGLCDLLDHLEERYTQMHDLVTQVAAVPNLETIWRHITGGS